MANRWGIPKEVEELVKARDLNCAYCGVSFAEFHGATKKKPSWKHIINDIRINGPENIALCCRSCNASKGARDLEIWLESSFCKEKGIGNSTLAPLVLEYLKKKYLQFSVTTYRLRVRQSCSFQSPIFSPKIPNLSLNHLQLYEPKIIYQENSPDRFGLICLWMAGFSGPFFFQKSPQR